jgi:hypothetical protein
MTKRRRFLKMATVGSLVFVLPASVFISVKSAEDIACDLIVDELHYLKLNREGVRKYVQDYLRMDRGLISQLRWRSYYLLNFNSEDSDNIRYLVSYYLLSSDFFINRMDESKTVNYIGINHQYTSACASHFSYSIYSIDNEV